MESELSCSLVLYSLDKIAITLKYLIKFLKPIVQLFPQSIVQEILLSQKSFE